MTDIHIDAVGQFIHAKNVEKIVNNGSSKNELPLEHLIAVSNDLGREIRTLKFRSYVNFPSALLLILAAVFLVLLWLVLSQYGLKGVLYYSAYYQPYFFVMLVVLLGLVFAQVMHRKKIDSHLSVLVDDKADIDKQIRRQRYHQYE